MYDYNFFTAIHSTNKLFSKNKIHMQLKIRSEKK